PVHAPAADSAGWQFPGLDLLQAAPAHAGAGPSPDMLQANARLLENVLADYGVQGVIGDIHAGPVVTLYELEPAPGIRSARVIGLADDVARSLSVLSVRIAVVPGRNVIGIEVPNARRETVYYTELLNTAGWHQNPSKLCLALGKDIAGNPVYGDLARMPHLLIAGTTGSGKSVGVNSMILSLLYRLSPAECRLIMIDPKILELSIYDGIPHLMTPVVTEPAKAVTALKWTVREMDRRYRAMAHLQVRNIAGYNDRVTEAQARGEIVTRRVQTGYDQETGRPIFEEQQLALETMPYIVVVIDEMADLMMVAGKEIESAVQRLAQKARAAGIHVIMATQRPSVDVITGTIKANFPTRISFQVISKFDSRTILGEQGAEQLLGQGDMLYMQGGGRITRVHGPFVSDGEVENVVAFLRAQGEPVYNDDVTSAEDEESSGGGGSSSGNGLGSGGYDAETSLFDQAVAIVAREGKASTSFIQRHLSIGYNRAAKLIEQMEKEGIVSQANHVGRREVLIRRTDADD
ncbi:DNA translocase FtsK, partial [Ameyamaea chiangmaiensis]